MKRAFYELKFSRAQLYSFQVKSYVPLGTLIVSFVPSLPCLSGDKFNVFCLQALFSIIIIF